jgi:colanic acid/amylovoran biosynthesis glycosyltransferase
MRVGYVVHTYPAPSHAFIQREIFALRSAGAEVCTLSIHRAAKEQLLSGDDVAESKNADSILPPGWVRLIRAHLSAFRHPGAYLKTMRYSLRQSGVGARAHLWQLFYFVEAMSVWSWARRNRLNHLHAHFANVATDVVWLASFYDRLLREAESWQWTFTMHGPTEFYAVERFNLGGKVAAADAVICISEFCRSQLMLLSPPSMWDKLVVVHCGADLAHYTYRGVREIDGPALSVLCVGRLVPRKGQLVLLEAVHLLAGDDNGTSIAVTLVGDGPAEGELRDTVARLDIASRVQFVGAVGQEEVPRLMETHDVFCLPSFAEGVPVVLMEAMAVGLPVVSTTIAGVPELVINEESGLLVPPGRADLLANALARLVGDGELRSRLSIGGRKVVETDFDSLACGAKLANVFTTLNGTALGPSAPEETSRQKDLLYDL